MATIDAAPRRVKKQAVPKAVQEFNEAANKLASIVRELERTPPTRFRQVVDRHLADTLKDLAARGLLGQQQIVDQLRQAAGMRASCHEVLDELFPAPRNVFQAREALGFTFAEYRPGDEPDELIKRFLPRDGVTMIGGQSGAGKTFLLVEMALALATGRSFMGHPVRERVGVIIAAAEGAGTLAARLEAAKRHAGVTGALPIAILTRVPDLSSPQEGERFAGDVALIAQQMEGQFGVRVGALAIDTVTSAFSIENENDNSEAAQICKVLAWYAATLKMAVLPVHHFGKSADQGLRGASAWRANVDHGIAVMAERDGATGEVKSRHISIMKSRIGEEGPVCGMQLVSIPLGENRYGEQVTTCAVDVAEMPAPAPKPQRKFGEGDIAFADAFNECCIHAQNEGRKRRVFGDGPIVPEVLLKSVQNEFKRRYAADGDNPAEALRKAWNRAKSNAIGSRKYATETDGQGRIYINLVREDKAPSRETKRDISKMSQNVPLSDCVNFCDLDGNGLADDEK